MATPRTCPQRDRGSRANRVTVSEGLSGGWLSQIRRGRRGIDRFIFHETRESVVPFFGSTGRDDSRQGLSEVPLVIAPSPFPFPPV